MFNLFSKNQEPENHTLSEEEMERRRARRQELLEKWKKEAELYDRIIKNDENLSLVLSMIVHRLDLITDIPDLEPLQKRLEEMFPESND